MALNRGVAYVKPGEVRVESIDFPKLVDATHGTTIEHGVILKIISTNICGSDQHMVRGRTTAPSGLVLGHESPAKLSRRVSTWNSSRWATSSRCRSTSRVGAAVHAARGTRASASL
jgi:hypothetical protein